MPANYHTPNCFVTRVRLMLRGRTAIVETVLPFFAVVTFAFLWPLAAAVHALQLRTASARVRSQVGDLCCLFYPRLQPVHQRGVWVLWLTKLLYNMLIPTSCLGIVQNHPDP